MKALFLAILSRPEWEDMAIFVKGKNVTCFVLWIEKKFLALYYNLVWSGQLLFMRT